MFIIPQRKRVGRYKCKRASKREREKKGIHSAPPFTSALALLAQAGKSNYQDRQNTISFTPSSSVIHASEKRLLMLGILPNPIEREEKTRQRKRTKTSLSCSAATAAAAACSFQHGGISSDQSHFHFIEKNHKGENCLHISGVWMSRIQGGLVRRAISRKERSFQRPLTSTEARIDAHPGRSNSP